MRARLPSLHPLTASLSEVFRGNGSTGRRATILDWEANVFTSTFSSEIVTCRFDDGTKRRLLCKHGAGHGSSVHGHKGGPAYEAEVYRHLLQPLPVTIPTFHGAYTDTRTGETWLILEYLDQAVRVSKMPDPAAMRLAARWIGRFHALSEACLTRTPSRFLCRYDEDYYVGWARRTSLFAGQWHQRFEWLAPLCRRFEELVSFLLAIPPTIIHGEYTPHNVLFRGGAIYPVDWESAAVGVGEIDLAVLTAGWPAQTLSECALEYQQARWPDGPPADFERTLGAAQLYQHFRWLGEQPHWSTGEISLEPFEQLRSGGERLGLI